MLRKTLSGTPKVSCERQNSVACFSMKKSEKVFVKPKKIVVSKKPHVICSAVTQDGKCSSTGKISSKTRSTSTKHVTKSDLTVCKKQQQNDIFDHPHQCGDTGLTNLKSGRPGGYDDVYDSFSKISTLVNKKGKAKQTTGKFKSMQTEKSKSIEEYYKNENFQRDARHAVTATKKESELLPIKELPEILKDSSDCYLESEKTSVEDKITAANDSDKQDTLKELKEFREKNYFECHSSATRVTSKADVISLEDHKCKYRFYLNDRLFPVPLNSDHNNTIRCTHCHLPYEESRSTINTTKVLNGTIQAKVKFGVDDETQDITLLLPVQKPLIIREKRAEKSKPQDDIVMYFGIVRLTPSGHSMFHRNLPDDSLALKYQKGYREFSGGERPAYVYDTLDKGDVIII